MTVIAKSATPSMSTVGATQVVAGNIYAGEELEAVAPCYIKSDGKVYMCDGVADAEAAKFVGFTARHTELGEPVTLYGFGTRFKYGSGLTPDAVLYLAENDGVYNLVAGALDDAVTTGDTQGTALVVSATDIVVCRVDPKSG
jgi:hypothetical protein